MSILIFLRHFPLEITIVSASAVFAESCCRDHFLRLLAGFLAGVCGLSTTETLINFEIRSSVPWGICWVITAYHCHNSLQADSGRKPYFLFTHPHIFLSNILRQKRIYIYLFIFQTKTSRKGHVLGPYMCMNLNSPGGWHISEDETVCKKLQCSSILLHTNFNVVSSHTSLNKS